MAVGVRTLGKAQLGKQVSFGTPVAATAIWRGPLVKLKDTSEHVFPDEDVAIIGGVGRNYIPKYGAEIEVTETEATFEQLGYLLNMGIVGVAGVQDGAGSDYIYTRPYPSTVATVPYYYTWEVGDNTDVEEAYNLFATEVTISGAAEQSWMMSAALLGALDETDPTTAFTGALPHTTPEEIQFGKTKLYIDAIGGTIGTTQKSDTLLSFTLKISKVYVAKSPANGSSRNFTLVKNVGRPEITLEFTLEHDATAVAERAIRRARTERQIRIKGEGSAIVTPGTTYSVKTAILDIVGTYMEPETYEDEDTNNVMKFKIKDHYSSTTSTRGKTILVNSLSVLP